VVRIWNWRFGRGWELGENELPICVGQCPGPDDEDDGVEDGGLKCSPKEKDEDDGATEHRPYINTLAWYMNTLGLGG
jgi:hypothetical protein